MKTSTILIGGVLGFAAFMLLKPKKAQAAEGAGAGNAERDNDRIVDYIPPAGVAAPSVGSQAAANPRQRPPATASGSPSVLTQIQRGGESAASIIADGARAGAKVIGAVFGSGSRAATSAPTVSSPPIVRPRSGLGYDPGTLY